MYFILAILLYGIGLAVASAIDPTYGVFAVGMIYYTWPFSIVCIVVIWLILRALFKGRLGPPRP
jgi:p-aminobenzoyl-glutamate transporter AbgT